MHVPVTATLTSCIPYDLAFIANVALEASGNCPDLEALARRHGVRADTVDTWRRHLARHAEDLFGATGAAQPDLMPRAGSDDRLAALDQIDVCIAILAGPSLRFRYANPAYRHMAGVPGLIGQRFREVFPVSASDGVENGLLNVLATGQSWQVSNFSAYLPGQEESVWEGRVSRLDDMALGEPALMVWIRDITAGSRIEQSLRQEIDLLRAISENSTDVMFAKDRQGCMQFANPAALALIGKPLAEVLGKTDAQFLNDPDAARRIMENDCRIMETGHAEEVEEPVPMPDGTLRIWLSQKRPCRDRDGHIVGLLGVSRDITYRKNAEDKVRAAHDTLQRVLDSITDGLAMLDRHWHYTYFSETGARMLGVRAEDLIGKYFWDVFPDAERLLFGREFRRAMETGVATHFEEYYPAPLNMWVECHCYPSPDGLSVYFRDVSEQRKVKEAALENERRMNALHEATPVGIAYVDAGGKVLFMNQECTHIWGNPPQANATSDYVEWKGWWADHSERHGQAIEAHEWPTARALRGEHVIDTAVDIEPFDRPGTRSTILHRSVPILDDGGCIRGAVTALMDITEFVQTKREVVESNHRIQQLANTIPQLAWMADRDGCVHWCNERWLSYTGDHARTANAWTREALHDPLVLPHVLERWTYSLKHATPFEMTFPLKGQDGLFRPFYTLAEPLKDLDGKVVQWFGTCTDVSTLQRAQEDLTKTQHWLQEGLVTANMVAWEWEWDSDQIRYSGNAAAVLGYAPATFKAMFETVHEQDRASYAAAMECVLGGLGVIDQITRRIRPDNGKTVSIRLKGNVLIDQDGRPSTMRGIMIDVTDQVLREQSLEEANNRKDEFLAMLAHELRNPLAPIATAAQLLLLGASDAARIKGISEIIIRQISHMTRLIDDLLDVSRVTRGLVELVTEPVRMQDIADNAIEQARPLIEARKHELVLHVDARPALVLGDPVRLCQVLVNLLNNAAKYTPQGGKIVLEIAVDNGAREVQVTVSDNGIGIESTLLPEIFGLFTQATRTPDRRQGGLGLGLALVDSLIRKHGGRVTAVSEGLGKGSRFIAVLPLSGAVADGMHGQTGEASATAPDAGPLTVTVVDDNADAADMLADVLRLRGHTVAVHYSSTAALAAARTTQSDLFILDIGLPDLDGYELGRQLRSMARHDAAVLVALTGYGQAHDKVLSRSAGFAHHLVKPVDLQHLDAILRSVHR